jgi:hypothetical protein
VDRVEILEQTSDGTFGGVCPDGFVYNLEVESTHNYFANSVLVHNCHEYGTDGSAQERAIHRLSEKIPLKLPLTGSLMNGYAKSLFRNMWSFSRRMREGGMARFEARLDTAGRLKASVYSREGQLLRVLMDEDMPAGVHAFEWDGANSDGHRVAPGIYTVIVDRGGPIDRRRVLVK